MIIPCPKCNRKFKIDNSIIPDGGRNLQCGSCNHIWFYKKNVDKTELLEPIDRIATGETETEVVKKNEEKIINTDKPKNVIQGEKKEKILDQQKTLVPYKEFKNKNEGSKFFSYIIVFIISFIIFVILLDTLKTPLISVFPWLEIIIFNLYETLQDIKLFTIDLF
tara:strand:- start:387 stop:881 length:495 start_codon:yes stop_codon:yes gene_type:complete